MGFSMSDKPIALLIVEGSDEKTFFDCYKTAYQLDFEIICFETNIYSLFSELKKYGFDADIKKVLELRDPKHKDILSQKFAYTYLIFDLDAHHTLEDDNRSLTEIFESNIRKAHKMAKVFTDETDPTKGRLYINYPMFESFRACDSFEDENYRNEIVTLTDAAHFKQYVASKKLTRVHMRSYTKENFSSLMKLNVFKLNQLAFAKWEPLDYRNYLKLSPADTILSLEEDYICAEKNMPVLCTSLFLALDYYGNQNHWYDSVVRSAKNTCT
jgi:hypothetical protein